MVELNYCDKYWVIEYCVLPELTICNPLRNHSATWPSKFSQGKTYVTTELYTTRDYLINNGDD